MSATTAYDYCPECDTDLEEDESEGGFCKVCWTRIIPWYDTDEFNADAWADETAKSNHEQAQEDRRQEARGLR